MKKIAKAFLIVTGIIAALGLLQSPPDPMLLLYSIFAFAVLFRHRLVGFVRRIPLKSSVKFILLVIAAGLLAECLAWLGNYLARNENPALFHPQLIPDLMLGIGIYLGYAVAWIIILRYYRFSLLSVFVTGGLFGILIEGIFDMSYWPIISIIQNLITDPLTSILMSAYLFVVHGSVMGLGYFLVEEEFSDNDSKKSNSWIKYPIAIVSIYVVALIFSIIFGLIVTSLGLIPEPGLIWERPLF
ncbi:MAG: hypothetical protein V1645_04030 [archaeon]